MNRAICSGKFLLEGIDFKVLSDDEIADIHHASLEILEKTGVYVEDDDAIDLFHSISCRVEKVKDILVNHQPAPLSGTVADDLRRFVADVEKEWGVESKNPIFDPSTLVTKPVGK